MYQVEYLITLKNSEISPQDFVNDIFQNGLLTRLGSNKIEYKELVIEYEFLSGQFENTNDTYVDLTLTCNSESLLDDFSLFLEIIIANIEPRPRREIWNDLSMHYCMKAYPYISRIENLMRKFINKFMVTKIGHNWSTVTVPDEVLEQIKKRGKNVSKLNDYDFMHLSDFLFKDDFPKKERELLKKLKEVRRGALNLNYEEIINLVPASNWDKYFSKILSCNDLIFKSAWEKLSIKRNSIAHNKSFTRADFNEVVELSTELNDYLNLGIKTMENISVSAKEKQDFIRQELINEWQEIDSNLSIYDSERNHTKGYDIALYIKETLNDELDYLETDPITNANRIAQIHEELVQNQKSIEAGENTKKWYDDEIAKMNTRVEEIKDLLNIPKDQPTSPYDF